MTANDLRRTLSTWLIEAGVSDVVVSKMLGHVNTNMVHKVYGKPGEDAVGELLARQSAAIPRVRVLDVSDAERGLPGRNASGRSLAKTAKLSGPSGNRTRDLRIKSPQLCRLSYRPFYVCFW